MSGSCSVAPIERALMSYCSDLVNLQALHGADRAAEPRARLTAARDRGEALRGQLQRLTDALLAADADGGVPATFARRARELEADLAAADAEAEAAERDLAGAARLDLTGMDARWRALAAGVEAQDVDARLQVRQLVADTFARLVIYRRGIRPADTPDGAMDIVLVAKGGTGRLLRIDRSGQWLAAEDWAGALP